MHRRNGQYWVMFADPYGLDAIKDALPRLPKVRQTLSNSNWESKEPSFNARLF
jgi:hypothetical protein